MSQEDPTARYVDRTPIDFKKLIGCNSSWDAILSCPASFSSSNRRRTAVPSVCLAGRLVSRHLALQAHKFFDVLGSLTWIFWLFKLSLSANTLAKIQVAGSVAHAIGTELWLRSRCTMMEAPYFTLIAHTPTPLTFHFLSSGRRRHPLYPTGLSATVICPPSYRGPTRESGCRCLAECISFDLLHPPGGAPEMRADLCYVRWLTRASWIWPFAWAVDQCRFRPA